MALGVSVALDSDSTSSTDPHVTPTFNSSAGSIVFIFIGVNSNRTVTSVTRDGVTYTEEIFELHQARNTYIFRGVHSGAVTAKSISIDLSATSNPIQYCVWEVTGIDTGGTNGSDGVVQSDLVSSSAAAPNTVTGTLAAFADGDNRPMICALLARDESNDHFAAETGYTEEDEEKPGTITFFIGWHETATDTTPSVTAQNYAGSRGTTVYSMEMKPSVVSVVIERTIQDSLGLSEERRKIEEHLLPDVTELADALLRDIGKRVTDAASPLSDATDPRILRQILATDAVELSDSLTERFRDIERIILEEVELADQVRRVRDVTLLELDAVELADAIVRKLDRTALFSERIEVSDALRRKIESIVSEDADVSTVVLRTIEAIKNEVLFPLVDADTETAFRNILILDDVLLSVQTILKIDRTVFATDAVEIADQDFRDRFKLLIDDLILSDASIRSKLTIRELQDSVLLSDLSEKALSIILVSLLLLSDVAITEISAAQIITRIAQDAVLLSDVALREHEHILISLLGLSDVVRIVRLRFRTLADAVLLADQSLLTVDRSRTLAVALLLSDLVATTLDRTRLLTDRVSLSDTVTATIETGVQIITRLAQDSLILKDQFTRSIEYTRQDRIELEDSIVKQALSFRLALENVLLADATVLQVNRDRIIQVALLLEDTTTRLREITFRDTVDLDDLVTRVVIQAVLQFLVGIKIRIEDFLQTTIGQSRFFLRETEEIEFFNREFGFTRTESL